MKGGWYIVNMNKSCNRCEVKLEEGVNITPSRVKNKQWQCKTCHNEYYKKYYKNNKSHYNQVQKQEHKIPSAIYAILENKKIIYIGESKRPLGRIYHHFCKTGIKASNISMALFDGELERENLSYRILEKIEDKIERKSREQELITEYQPKYNKG